MVALEVDAFFLSAAAQHKERHHGEDYSCPLPSVESLTEYEHSSHKCHNGARGIDRTYDRQRQMLDTEITQYPTAQHYQAFEHNKLVHLPTTTAHVEYRSVESV